MKNKIYSVILFSFFFLLSIQSYAQSRYDQLSQRLARLNVKALSAKIPSSLDQQKIIFGKKLFHDVNLSGNKNVSCAGCHDQKQGTGDGRFFSFTQDEKSVVRRNAQPLFNMKTSQDKLYFWDGRVGYDRVNHVYQTPEPALNGEDPKAADIVESLEDGLAAQALFPLVSHEEMRGNFGDNEIANAKNNLEAWKKIVERIFQNAAEYLVLFEKAFPNEKFKEMNIGHVGTAMSRFMEYEFYTWDSPFNRLLNNDKTAMSEKELRGLEVFMGNGRCINCHQGPHLGNTGLMLSIGVPELLPSDKKRDLGRFEVTRDEFDKHSYKVPSLRNVALTAPYFHNGSKKTLREVVLHYNNVAGSIDSYVIPKSTQVEPVSFKLLNSEQERGELFDSVQVPFLKVGLGLTKQEVDDLVAFLEISLTDPKFK